MRSRLGGLSGATELVPRYKGCPDGSDDRTLFHYRRCRHLSASVQPRYEQASSGEFWQAGSCEMHPIFSNSQPYNDQAGSFQGAFYAVSTHIHGYLAYRIALRDSNASIRHEL